MSSSTSTELEVAGFHLEGELGRGSRAVVYEAIQVNLGRRVALKLLPQDEDSTGVRPLAWPEHPRVVSLYATGPWEQGRFVAMQLVRGPSLAELSETGELDPARRLELLADVASALDAAHRQGIAHGAVAARNVLVDRDGHALLSDFGLVGGEPSVAADRADFADLVRACLGDPLPRLPDPRSVEAGDVVRLAREGLPEASPGADAGRRGGGGSPLPRSWASRPPPPSWSSSVAPTPTAFRPRSAGQRRSAASWRPMAPAPSIAADGLRAEHPRPARSSRPACRGVVSFRRPRVRSADGWCGERAASWRSR